MWMPRLMKVIGSSIALRAIIVLVVGLCAVGIVRQRLERIDGRYDTSIVGKFYSAAFLEFQGTNVYFCDGCSAKGRMGHVQRVAGNAIWRVPGGTQWILKKSGPNLMCTDVEDNTNVFVLKPVLLAPARIVINGWWRQMRERWSE